MNKLYREIISKIRVEGVLMALALAMPTALAAENAYVITDLGTFGGAQSSANSINQQGQVVGSAGLSSTGTISSHAFLYSGGVMTDLGALGTNSSIQGPFSTSTAVGINNVGQIAGFSRNSSDAVDAFLYDSGAMNDLGTLPGSQQSKAACINDHGQIVGWSLPAGPQHAFLYDSGSMTDLGTLGGSASFAYCINNLGQIVGDSWTNTSGLSDIAFVYSNGIMSRLPNLGSLPAVQATAINDSGWIVGYAGTVDTGGPGTIERGFLFDGSQMTDLGNPGGGYTNIVPKALNDRGQIVGVAVSYQSIGHAFVYSDGVMRDLNKLIDPAAGWSLFHAEAINDNGQIVGTGQNAAIQTHGFLLTPRPSLQNLQWLGGYPQFNLAGMTGVVYSVEYATSLPATNWLVLSNLVMTSSPTPIVDATAPGSVQRYYRVVQH